MTRRRDYKCNGAIVVHSIEEALEEAKKFATEDVYVIGGGEIYKQVEFTLPYSDIYRNLFIIKKVKETPKKYPRKAGLPSKEPLV